MTPKRRRNAHREGIVGGKHRRHTSDAVDTGGKHMRKTPCTGKHCAEHADTRR